MTPRATHVVSCDGFVVLVHDEGFAAVEGGVGYAYASQVIDLAYVVYHNCLLVDDFFAHSLIVEVPEV